MISQAGWWTRMPSTTPLQPKNEMLIFGLRSTSDDQLGWSMDSNAIHNPPPAKEWNAHFWIMFNFWWLAGQVNRLKTHPPPPSSQKNEMPIFGLCSTSDDRPGWSMDSKPICNPSPTKKMKCSFLDYVQLLMIGRAGQWTRNPSTTPLQPKNEMLVFGLLSISGHQPGWSMDSNPIHHPSPTKEWNAHFWITFNFWWLARLAEGLESHLQPLSNQKNDMLIFGLRSTSYDWPGWSMDLNPICHPSPAKKMKWSSLDYVQFLMIGQAGRRTPTPSATLSNQKMKCLFLYYVIVQMISRVGRWTQNPSTTPQAKKMKC